MKNLYNTNFVLGEGPIPCKVMLIGEAPGQEEDESGIPFCGSCGKVLNNLLKKSADIPRQKIYVTNALKQRPPNNRKPTFEETVLHRKYLLCEIERVCPLYIVTLGKTALESVLGRELGALYPHLTDIEKKLLVLKGKKYYLLATYHPGALLRNSSFRGHMEKTFADLGRLYKKLEKKDG